MQNFFWGVYIQPNETYNSSCGNWLTLYTCCRDACKEQVNGFKGAQYKKFDSQDAANRFIAGDNSGTGYGRRNHFQQSSAAGNYYGGQNSNSGFHGNGQRSRSQSETYTGHGNQNNSASQNRYHPYSGHSTPRASQGNCKYISTIPVYLHRRKPRSSFHVRERNELRNMASVDTLGNQAYGIKECMKLNTTEHCLKSIIIFVSSIPLVPVKS